MVKLSESIVLARSRANDLASIKKLNCWGSNLTDISIMKDIPNIKVATFSMNEISSLEAFSSCSQLEELYIRRNQIADLSEVTHLQHLPRLRTLWLADNPCAVGDRYRATVLKTLPQLQRLDNIVVQEEEMEEAMTTGVELKTKILDLEGATGSTPTKTKPPIKKKPKKWRQNSDSSGDDDSRSIRSSRDDIRSSRSENRSSKGDMRSSRSDTRSSKGDIRCSREDIRSSRDDVRASREDVRLNGSKEDVGSGANGGEEEHIGSGGGMRVKTRHRSNSGQKSKARSGENMEQDERTRDSVETSSSRRDSMKHRSGSIGRRSDSGGRRSAGHRSDSAGDEETEGASSAEMLMLSETNTIRSQFGLKPLTMDNILPAKTAPEKPQNANLLQAVLCLIQELDTQSLEVVQDAISNKIHSSIT